MRLLAAAALSLLGCVAACSDAGAAAAEGKATTAANDVAGALAAITSPETATAAKDKLQGLVDQLAAVMPKLPATEQGGQGAEGVGQAATEAMSKAKAAFGPDLSKAVTAVTDQIKRLAADPKLIEPIQGVVNQLKGVLGIK